MLLQSFDSIKNSVVQIADSTLRQQIFSRIDLVGEKLGVAVEHIWSVLVRQAYAEAAISFVWLLTWLVGLYFCRRWHAWAWSDKNNLDGDGEEVVQVFSVITMMLTIVLGLVLVLPNVAHSVGYIVNPEYFAFKRAAELIFNITR